MKKRLGIITLVIILSCIVMLEVFENHPTKNNSNRALNSDIQNQIFQNIVKEEWENNTIQIKVQINDITFSGQLYDIKTTREFINLFPLTIKMKDLNKNEKYAYLNDAFTTTNELVDKIYSGDIMLFGNNCLVLFYEDFLSSFSYTRLGYLEESENLRSIVGNADVEIIFSLE